MSAHPISTLLELATAMSRINRWNGRGEFALSIAQHSVLLAAFVPIKLRKAALIHDVSEVKLGGDVVSPIKARCPDLQKMEDRIIRHIFRFFGVPYADYIALHPFDVAIRNDERAALWPDDPKVPGLGAVVEPTTPEHAADAWLYFVLNTFGERE